MTSGKETETGEDRRRPGQSGTALREDAPQHRLDGASTDWPTGPAGTARGASATPSRIVQGRVNGLDMTLVRPLTFMNESGLAVRKVLAREHAPLADLLVVADDFALPFGKLRFREGGGPGGHNGLGSIIDELGTEQFSRLRIGIGEPDRNGRDHVLSAFAPDERPASGRTPRRGRRRGRALGARGHEQGRQPVQQLPAARRRTTSCWRHRARWTGHRGPTGSAGRGRAGVACGRPRRDRE